MIGTTPGSQLDRLVAVLREIGAIGEITPPGVRDRLGISRKYMIPLLEWADRTGRDGPGGGGEEAKIEGLRDWDERGGYLVTLQGHSVRRVPI